MKAVPLFAIALLICGFEPLASADAGTEITQACFRATTGGERYTYCVHKVDPSVNPDIVYYLHGAYGSAQEWVNSEYFKKIYDAWGVQAPVVVSVSYGSLWLLAEKNGSSNSGLYEHFTKTALPAIEKAQNLVPARRMLVGASMGGFNASQIYLKNPELFAKVALLCPALAELGPYSSQAAINAYIERTHARRSAIENFIYLAQLYFPTRAAYQAADPFVVGQARITPVFPPLLVTAGTEDEYGFFEGASRFATLAASKGARASYLPVPGPHCSWDWQSAAQFVIQP